MTIVSITHLLDTAFTIGLTHQLAIYDSLYIALALELGYSLITIDNHQAQAALNCGVSLQSITNL